MKLLLIICVAVLLVGCRSEPKVAIDSDVYVLRLDYAGGKPVPYASVVVGDPKIASGAFSPNQEGIVRLGLQPNDIVTVFVDGFPERLVKVRDLKTGEANVVVIE